MSDRLPVHALDPGAATGGQVPTYDAASGRVIWAASGSTDPEVVRDTMAAALVAGSNVTITPNDAGDTITISATGGGGGSSSSSGPDGKPTIDTPPTTANAKDDEFNDATSMSGPVNGLNARWSKRNMGTAGWSVLSDTRAPGCYMFDIPTGQAVDQAIYQTAPATDFRLSARIMLGAASDRQMWGLFVLNSSGTGVALMVDDPAGDANAYLRNVTAWNVGATVAFVSSRANTEWVAGHHLYMSLRKSAGVYYSAIWGADRLLASEVAEVAATPGAFTPAYVGAGRTFGSGSSKVLLDWFRVS